MCPLQQEKLEGIANCNHLHLIFNKECFPRLHISVILLKGARIASVQATAARKKIKNKKGGGLGIFLSVSRSPAFWCQKLGVGRGDFVTLIRLSCQN